MERLKVEFKGKVPMLGAALLRAMGWIGWLTLLIPAGGQTGQQGARTGDSTRVADQAQAGPMTKQQAKQLFQSVDEIMQFASGDTGLPPALKVKRRLVTREKVNHYLIKNFDEDESAKRLQRSEIVLKKFGLLDREFRLRPFLLSLLTEQIAGFYDAKTKSINLLDWIPPEEQKPVLAHELTHAIQDQKVGLQKWSNTQLHGVSRTALEDNQRVQTDENETARQAVTEGQAMVVFVDWTLKPSGKTLLDSPELAQKMKEGAADMSGSPIMARAPLLLQRSLVFPYVDGMSFEQELLRQGGKQMAFAGALVNPPRSSFEILHPKAYMAHAAVPALRMPDVHALLDAEYEPYDLGVMGELDVEIMATLFGGAKVGATLPSAWDGGIYYAAQRKAVTAAEKETPGSLAVFYFSRWKSVQAAQSFARIYTAELGRKYTGLRERKRDEEGAGEQVFTTAEGDAIVAVAGAEVFIAEGFPVGTARRLRAEAEAAQGVGQMRRAAAPLPELTLGTAGALAEFGMLKQTMRGRYTAGQR